MATSVTVPCDCCESAKNTNCYEVVGWTASPLGTPACTTTANLNVTRRYISAPLGSSPSTGDIKGAIGGDFEVDCSNEASGFCQGKGASGSYPWENALYDSSMSTAYGADYSFLFEDCQLGSADMRIVVSTRYVGSCYLPIGAECDEDCKDEND